MTVCLCLVCWLLVGYPKEGRGRECSVQSHITPDMARLSLGLGSTDTHHATAGRLPHSAPHPARRRSHQRARRFCGVPVYARHGICSSTGSLCTGELDRSASSCPFYIHPSRSDWLVKPWLSRDRSFHLNSDGWWGFYFFSYNVS